MQEFVNFLKRAVTPYHMIQEVENYLLERGFLVLNYEEEWKIECGKKYFVKKDDSFGAAFVVGKEKEGGFKIGAAHTDFPCLKVKTNPEVCKEGYKELNTEVYGGAILNTWMDRPLSVAGRVALKTDDVWNPEIKLIDLKRPVLTIPNLAVHMNPDINKGVSLNKQTELIPIGGTCGGEEEQKDYFMELLAREAGRDKSDILSYELFVYNAEEPCLIGFEEEFLSAPRLDNATSVYALMKAIGDMEAGQGIKAAVFFDHEEVGSCTKQGAASLVFPYCLEKLYTALGYTRAEYISSMEAGMMLSLDVAHGAHPNYGNKADITNRPLLNKGFCIKESGSQSYATDCKMIGIIRQLCMQEEIAVQTYANRSDVRGGSTLGALAAAVLPLKIADAGVPVFAMHSARELMGKDDLKSLKKLIISFFS